MSDDAFEFVVVHQLEEPFGSRHGGVRWVSPGGEGIWRRLRNYIELRHRQVAFGGQAFHHLIEPWGLLARYGAGSAGGQGDLVGEKIGYPIHKYGDDQPEGHALPSSDCFSPEQQE